MTLFIYTANIVINVTMSIIYTVNGATGVLMLIIHIASKPILMELNALELLSIVIAKLKDVASNIVTFIALYAVGLINLDCISIINTVIMWDVNGPTNITTYLRYNKHCSCYIAKYS